MDLGLLLRTARRGVARSPTPAATRQTGCRCCAAWRRTLPARDVFGTEPRRAGSQPGAVRLAWRSPRGAWRDRRCYNRVDMEFAFGIQIEELPVGVWLAAFDELSGLVAQGERLPRRSTSREMWRAS